MVPVNTALTGLVYCEGGMTGGFGRTLAVRQPPLLLLGSSATTDGIFSWFERAFISVKQANSIPKLNAPTSSSVTLLPSSGPVFANATKGYVRRVQHILPVSTQLKPYRLVVLMDVVNHVRLSYG